MRHTSARALPAARLTGWLAAVVFVSTLVLPAGCGGGGGGNGTGTNTGGPTPTPTATPSPTPTPMPTPTPPAPVRAAYRLEWGARSRATAVPSSALSIQVTVQGAAQDGADAVARIDRRTEPAAYGQDLVTPFFVRPGNYPVLVRAFAERGGQGALVASGGATVTVHPDGSGIGTINLTGTIAAVEVAAAQVVTVAESWDVLFAGRTAAGDLVPLAPGAARFALLGGEANLRLTVGGVAEGVRPGRATLKATVDGIDSAPTELKVTSRAAVAITPKPLTVSVGSVTPLSAAVTGAPDAGVVWSMQAGDPGVDVGSVSPQGVYTAPAKPGVFRVVATSAYDTEKSDVLEFTVQSGNLPVIVD
ncbi:MAG TPA: hypothetical protein VM490_07355 [Armatimonadaceae bacterium]|nr:hypothetical protein [Armatimonadaceae bacterium]